MNQTQANTKFMLTLIIAFVAAGQLAMGLYLPSLPAIAGALHVSSAAIQQSFSLFMMAYGISQLFYGALSDHYGRRPLLLWGMTILVAGTLWAGFATTMTGFLLARIIQGAGAGSVAVLARSIIFDMYPEEKVAEAMALMVIAVSITPAVSPYIGGQLQHFSGWRSNFIVLFAYLILLILMVYRKMPETNVMRSILTGRNIQLLSIIKNYWALLKNRLFISHVMIVISGFACQLLYLSLSPFIFQKQFHINASHYGVLMILPAIAYLLGNTLSNRLNSVGMHYAKIMLIGIFTSVFFSITLLILCLMHRVAVISLLSGISGIMFSYGLIASNAITGAVAPFKQQAGTASSLVGVLQMMGSSLIVSFISICAGSNSLALSSGLVAVSFVMLGFAAFILSRLSSRQTEKS